MTVSDPPLSSPPSWAPGDRPLGNLAGGLAVGSRNGNYPCTRMSGRPTLLILSFSVIDRDARVLKQVRMFADDYEVVTCGFGPQPEGSARHIRIPDGLRANDLDGRLITLRMYRRAHWSTSAVSWVKQNLERGAFDIVLADEADAAPLALWLRPPLGVHVDLHEYHPRVKEDQPLWDRRIRPYVEWLCRTYVSRADSTTTVSEGVAAEYERVFGFRPVVVTNATGFVALAPTPSARPLRFVHSGGSQRSRNLAATVQAFLESTSGATLDMYLVANDPANVADLRALAASGDGRVRILDAVPYEELIQTLSGYDVGIFVLPHVTFNYKWALPNKLFDFVQARLATVVGPSPEMEGFVRRYGVGVVTDGFEPSDITRAIDALTPEAVDAMKSESDRHAAELAREADAHGWREAIDALASRGAERRA